ncbi:hypothetical protein MSPP1_001819 [Malassezia sp. CBS 17886]|nr:hypothetical protein MSPP1_001819 [Malassezia sp. CBS 17886]
MLPFRAPSGGAPGARAPLRDASGSSAERHAVHGRRMVSQGLARTQRGTELGAPNAPALHVDNTSFEEWMKMATDNKINATNTWSFALIDYFHDMSLLRSDSGDGSINFQKASCTLDGCVKVWTSRVDSVMVETGRLLSGLQDEESPDAHATATQGAGGSDDDVDADNADATGRPSRRRARARDATLAKDFAQLQAKRFDLEFSVDPLFKKTSADFDEGGAGGLLMNHLHVDDQMKVVFDASDVGGRAEGEGDGLEEGEGAEEGERAKEGKGAEEGNGEAKVDPVASGPTKDERVPSAQHSPSLTPAPPTSSVDIDRIRGALFAAAAATDLSCIATDLETVLQTRVLCPSMSAFRFSDDNTMDLPTLLGDDAAAQADGDAAGLDDIDAYAPLDDALFDAASDAGEVDFFDGHRGADDRAFDVAFAHPVDTDELADEHAAAAGPPDDNTRFFEHFDQGMKKSWAGPEHWKMSRLRTPRETPPAPADEGAAADERPRARRAKGAVVIDFLADDADVSASELFAPSAAGIQLPKAVQASTATHLLPDDQHFSSKRLLRLFLKPKAAILLQQRAQSRARSRGQEDARADGWEDAALADAGVGEDVFPADVIQDTDVYDDVLAPAGDAPLPPDELDMDSDAEEDALAVDALRRVRPEYVEHAKRAKQVDVKKLKDTIWSKLALPDAAADDSTAFGTVLQGLESAYPKARMDEISTSFCFICLLHLANEEGLQIAPPDHGDGDDSDERRVGAIDELKVRRDPSFV